jgi:hypothetical protein
MGAQGVSPQPTDDNAQPVTNDPCEQDQEASIARCQGDDPAKNGDFQGCVMEAFQRFQKCKGAG